MTYNADISPLFEDRCTICHENANPIGVNIENPYDARNGLLVAPNQANADEPGVALEYNVVAGDPSSSYLINKLTGDLPADGSAGERMPLQIEPLTDEELEIVEQWVLQGANNDAFYQDEVQPIFGYREKGRYGKCVLCHYRDTPNPPDLTDPFDPEQGVLRRASYRGDLQRVVPGDPEASFLVLKVRAREREAGLGEPMPFSYDNFSPQQIELVSQWITDGAPNN